MNSEPNNRRGIVDSMVQHKGFVYLAVIAMVAVGIVGLFRMNKDEFPTFDIKQGLVAGIYPGASSQEVEEQLTKPLEEVLFSFKEVDMKKTYSYSKDGICYIYADLNCPDKKKDEVWSKIKLKLNDATATLPTGVLAVRVLDDFSATSTLLVAMTSKEKGYSELQDYAEELSSRLRKIPELASVKILGSRSEEIAVDIDMARVSAYGISPASLMLDYQTSSLAVPSGSLDNGTIKVPVHVRNEISAENEVAQKIIYSDPSGEAIRLKDIAKIERRCSDPTSFVSYNGASSLILSIEMRPDNNVLSFGEDVDVVLNKYRSDIPESVTITKITDQPLVVRTSVMDFLRDLVISMIVVILVMLILFPLRSALISSSGIPVIIALTIAVMYLTGINLHTVTLAALITVLGMIVDDSVITMDGYMDKLSRGLKPIAAANASVKELFMPMLMATLAISLMFFPTTVIITGYLGDFTRTFPWVVGIALMISLAYAVLVVPTLMTKFINPQNKSRKSAFSKVQEAFFHIIQKGYESLLSWCFKHTGVVVVGAIAAIALGILMFLQLNVQMMPMASRDCFALEITTDANSPVAVTRTITDSLEHLMLEDSRVRSVTSFVGESAPRFAATYAPKAPASNFAQVIVNTLDANATEELLSEYDKIVYNMFPNAVIRLKQIDYQAVPAQIEVMVSGAGRDVLYPIADQIKGYMMGMDDILQWVHCDNDYSLSTVEVVLDNDEAARLGVNRSIAALSVAGAVNGTTLATLYENGRAVPVKLYSSLEDDKKDFESLGNHFIPTYMPGTSVPLRQVAEIRPEWYPENLARYGGDKTVVVAADLRYDKSNTVAMSRLKKYIDNEIIPFLPEGVTIEYGGLAETNSRVAPEILWSFVAAVAVLFIFLLIHFKKLSLAVMSIGMSALCLFGSSFGLWAFNKDFGITSVLGLISLVGIIIRNGIILFDYAEELRREKGLGVSEAAYEAGCRRMRPIFLTSVTTALGVLPMVLNGGPLWQPMGLVISFGTVLSIFLIVLVMPVTYKIVFKNSNEYAVNKI